MGGIDRWRGREVLQSNSVRTGLPELRARGAANRPSRMSSASCAVCGLSAGSGSSRADTRLLRRSFGITWARVGLESVQPLGFFFLPLGRFMHWSSASPIIQRRDERRKDASLTADEMSVRSPLAKSAGGRPVSRKSAVAPVEGNEMGSEHAGNLPELRRAALAPCALAPHTRLTQQGVHARAKTAKQKTKNRPCHSLPRACSVEIRSGLDSPAELLGCHVTIGAHDAAHDAAPLRHFVSGEAKVLGKDRER